MRVYLPARRSHGERPVAESHEINLAPRERISGRHSSRGRRNARQKFLLGCDSPYRGIWSAVVHREGVLTDSSAGRFETRVKAVSVSIQREDVDTALKSTSKESVLISVCLFTSHALSLNLDLRSTFRSPVRAVRSPFVCLPVSPFRATSTSLLLFNGCPSAFAAFRP